MVKKFDLLTMPTEIIKPILEEWDPDVVIDASMRSPSLKEQIETFKLPCKAIAFNAEENGVSLTVNFRMCDIRMVCRNMDNGFDRLRKVNGNYIMTRMSEKITNQFGEESVTMTFETKNESLEGQQVVLEEVLKHLLSILKVETFNFNCKQVTPILGNLFFWNYSKIFDTITIERPDRRPTILSPDQLVFMLEELQAEKRNLRIKVNGFKYEKAIPGKEINLHYMNWVTAACLMGPEVVKVKTFAHPTPDMDINEIFLHWLNGGSPHLEKMSLHIVGYDTTPQKLFRDLPLKPTMFPAAEMHRRLADVYHNPQDVQRQSDGRLATMTFMNGLRVELSVWHRKHLVFMDPLVCNVLKSHHYGVYFS